MAGFVGAEAIAALLFWMAALISGMRGVLDAMGPTLVSLFVALHIPAAIAGILLWQWTRRTLRPAVRVVLEAATLYFGLAVIVGLLVNVMAASLLDALRQG